MIAPPSTISLSIKLPSIVVSHQAVRPSMLDTGEFFVRFCADERRKPLINLDDCVMPVVMMPMISKTIDNSISVKAVRFLDI